MIVTLPIPGFVSVVGLAVFRLPGDGDQFRVTRTTASRGSRITGLGLSRSANFPCSMYVKAFMGSTSDSFGTIIAHHKEKIYLASKTGSENESTSGINKCRLIHGGKEMSILEFCDRKLSKLEIAVLDFLTAHDTTYHMGCPCPWTVPTLPVVLYNVGSGGLSA